MVNEEGVVLGRITKAELKPGSERRAEEIMHPGPSTFRPDVPIAQMQEWFARRKADSYIITTPDGRLWGVLYRKDVQPKADDQLVTPGRQ